MSQSYSCAACREEMTSHHLLVSKAFQGRNGRAFLFAAPATNIRLGAVEERMLMTGLHSVCDVHCLGCSEIVGWKYEGAAEPSQQYKVGKFIFEHAKLFKEFS